MKAWPEVSHHASRRRHSDVLRVQGSTPFFHESSHFSGSRSGKSWRWGDSCTSTISSGRTGARLRRRKPVASPVRGSPCAVQGRLELEADQVRGLHTRGLPPPSSSKQRAVAPRRTGGAGQPGGHVLASDAGAQTARRGRRRASSRVTERRRTAPVSGTGWTCSGGRRRRSRFLRTHCAGSFRSRSTPTPSPPSAAMRSHPVAAAACGAAATLISWGCPRA